MNIREKQELLAYFLIKCCGLTYDEKVIPVSLSGCREKYNVSDISNCKMSIYINYIDKHGIYTSVQIGTYNGMDFSRSGDIKDLENSLDEIKRYYCNHHKNKIYNWNDIKKEVERKKNERTRSPSK